MSTTLSPRTIVTGKPIDFNKKYTTHVGTYVLVHTENTPTNTMAPRALSCIYLNPMDNKQGGHELLNLVTSRIITCTSYTEVPLTNIAMERVHYLAEKDKISSTLTFLNHKGNIILDYNSINGGVIMMVMKTTTMIHINIQKRMTLTMIQKSLIWIQMNYWSSCALLILRFC